jgi:glycosyltransferase involved in cell wall biosynthesis
MEKDLISVVIPYYNKCNTISRAIVSVLKQTYYSLELLIIDDYSDQPLDIASLPVDSRILFLSNSINLGAAQTRQRGLNLSRGKFIAFLDADDWWDPNFLDYCLIVLLNNELSDGAYVKTQVLHPDGTHSLRRHCDIGFTKIRETLIQYSRPWQTGGILWRKSSCGDWGSLKTNEDSWFEISSSKYNCLLPVNIIGYFVDQSGEAHLSASFTHCNVAQDVQSLFLRILECERNKLSLGIRITLFLRIVRGQLRILEYCGMEIANLIRKDISKNSRFMGMICKNRLTMKLIHRVLQATPYKIHF